MREYVAAVVSFSYSISVLWILMKIWLFVQRMINGITLSLYESLPAMEPRTLNTTISFVVETPRYRKYIYMYCMYVESVVDILHMFVHSVLCC